MLLFILAAIFIRIKVRRFTDLPGKFQNGLEAIVEAFEGLLISAVGERLSYLGNWFFMVFAFLLTSSLSGLVGFRPPTADWATTFAFALGTFILIQAIGIKCRGFGYIRSFFEPYAIMFPINIVGELARPISLSFRLFGNVLSGLIIMTFIYSYAPVYLRVIVPAALHAYFDVFLGLLQTYIFVAMSMTFIEYASVAD
jgi:F-type H+-transporting ATPase subunit a